MAKKKEPTVEEKLRALYDLQLIDSRIDGPIEIPKIEIIMPTNIAIPKD